MSILTASNGSGFLPGTVGVSGHVDMTGPHLSTATTVYTMLQTGKYLKKQRHETVKEFLAM
jgi:hypothetical protein